jgi:hypothetical protein
MKLSEMALEEAKGVIPFLASLLFVRLVNGISPQHKASFVIFGVPPWRELEIRDVYVKRAVQF